MSSGELSALAELFETLSTSDKTGEAGLDITTFRDLMHSSFDIDSELIMDRIFRAFNRRGPESRLNLEDFLDGLKIFLKGTPQEKLLCEFWHATGKVCRSRDCFF